MTGYFDHNATTPLDPRVRDAMLPWLDQHHGNPSSAHRWGRDARRAVERARRQVAELIGAAPAEVVFTASGTEANNAVILGAGGGDGREGAHLVIASFEHPSVTAAARHLERTGTRLSVVPPRRDGVVAAEDVLAALTPDTRLVTLMLANNVLGTLQPVAEVAAACRQRGVPVLTDAVQAVGKVTVDVAALGVDYLTLGGHKFHGPYGAAALWIRPGAPFAPLLLGAPQESGRRASTENVPALVGLGAAAAFAQDELARRHADLAALRDRLESGFDTLPGAVVHCRRSPRLPHTSHVAFRGRSGHDLMLHLDAAGFAVSTGAACSAGRPQPSPAVLAIGGDQDEALASLRISVGITNTAEQVDALLDALRRALAEPAARRAL